MSDNNESPKTPALRAMWATSEPTRHDFAAVVNEIIAAKLVGEGRVFERGPYVPITHLAYFKPPMDAFAVELKTKDRRSVKEWEYVNAAGVWLETGLAALTLTKDADDSTDTDVLARRLSLAEKSLKAALEVLSRRAQYFRDITDHGFKEAGQIAFLVEQGHDAVHSESYRAAREALTSNLEIEAAKQLAKSRLEWANNPARKGKQRGSAKGGATASEWWRPEGRRPPRRLLGDGRYGEGTAAMAKDILEVGRMALDNGDVRVPRPTHQVWCPGYASGGIYGRGGTTPNPPNRGGQGRGEARSRIGCQEWYLRGCWARSRARANAARTIGVVGFVVWQGDEKKGRFVVNLSKQSQHWPKGSIKMETLPSFALEAEKGYYMLSFDIKAGYQHFYLHPEIRDFFFYYEGRYYRCVALPFGWGRSPLWITKILRGFVRYLRMKCKYRVLPYLDDFLVAPSPPARAATPCDVAQA